MPVQGRKFARFCETDFDAIREGIRRDSDRIHRNSEGIRRNLNRIRRDSRRIHREQDQIRRFLSAILQVYLKNWRF